MKLIAARRSTIRSITPKTGSAGPLVFVEVDHSFLADDEMSSRSAIPSSIAARRI